MIPYYILILLRASKGILSVIHELAAIILSDTGQYIE